LPRAARTRLPERTPRHPDRQPAFVGRSDRRARPQPCPHAARNGRAPQQDPDAAVIRSAVSCARPRRRRPVLRHPRRFRGRVRRDRGGVARTARLGRRTTGRPGNRELMRRWAFLLRPAWLALFVVVVAFAYLCFTVLAPWQLGKNTKTSRENTQISNSLTADPVPLTTFLPQQDSSAPDAQWRRVTATGHYLPGGQVLARLRVVDGGPVVLVDRGYVRPVQGSKVPTITSPPSGTVAITARLRDSEPVVRGK